MATELTIRNMAERCGLSEFTLRYYERVGLIRRIGRAPNGHRRYSAQDETWIEFLNHLRATGMPIRQMLRYAELRAQGDRTAVERRELLEEHRRAVEANIKTLEECHALLTRKIAFYRQIERKLEPTTSPRIELARRGGAACAPARAKGKTRR